MSTTCFILTLINLCQYCFGIGGMWLMHWNSVVVSHMRGGAVFVFHGQGMWAQEYSKLYGWHIIHLHECSHSVKSNANPANHLKAYKVGHCLLFISVTKKVSFFTCIHCISVRTMTFIYSQRLSCLTEVFERRRGKWCLKPSHDNAIKQAKMKNSTSPFMTRTSWGRTWKELQITHY